MDERQRGEVVRLSTLINSPTSALSLSRIEDLCPRCAVEFEVNEHGQAIVHGCCNCRDAGRISYGLRRSDPGFGKAVLCPECIARPAVEGAAEAFDVRRARIPLALESATLNTWKPDDAGPVRAVREWSQQQWPMNRMILLLSGPPGRGKSHLAAAAVKAVWDRHGKRGRFWVVPELLDRIRATYSEETRRETVEAVHGELLRTPVLVLDDLGTEKATDWAGEQVFKIIDQRYREGLPLIVTTNLEVGALDARLYSRLMDKQHATVVNIDGAKYPDHRRAG